MNGPWFACPRCAGTQFDFSPFYGIGDEPTGGLSECLACGAQFRNGHWYGGTGTVCKTRLRADEMLPDFIGYAIHACQACAVKFGPEAPVHVVQSRERVLPFSFCDACWTMSTHHVNAEVAFEATKDPWPEDREARKPTTPHSTKWQCGPCQEQFDSEGDQRAAQWAAHILVCPVMLARAS